MKHRTMQEARRVDGLEAGLQVRVIAALVFIAALLTSWAAYGQSYDPWLRQREVDAAERAARAAERQAEAAEAQADAARRGRIERCFARGERERCIAMMTPSEQLQFTSMEGAAQAGRGLGEALRALIGTRSTEENAAARLRALHPDFEQILADQSFRRWVNDSPTRRELLAKAHSQYDVAAADMLFSAWKQLRATK